MRVSRPIWAIAALAALVMAPGAARAQEDSGPVEKQWALKVGGFFPTHGTLRGQAGSPYYALGLEWDPNLRFKLANGRITFGAEVLYRENASGRFLTLPLTANVKWTIARPQAETSVYGGVGVAMHMINTGFIGQEIQPGLRFSAGVNMNDRWFVEANYDWVSGYTDSLGTGVRHDGVSLLLGYRY